MHNPLKPHAVFSSLADALKYVDTQAKNVTGRLVIRTRDSSTHTVLSVEGTASWVDSLPRALSNEGREVALLPPPLREHPVEPVRTVVPKRGKPQLRTDPPAKRARLRKLAGERSVGRLA